MLKRILSHSLVRNSGIFFSFSLISSLTGFFVQPILSHYLSPQDFGVIGIFVVALTLFTPIIGLSANSIIARSYNTRDDVSYLIGSSIIFSFGIFIFTIVIAILLPASSYESIGISRGLIILAIIGALASIINATFLTVLQLEKKAVYWGVSTLAGLFFNILLTFGLLFLTPLTYEARIIGLVGAPYISSIIGYFFLKKSIPIKFAINKNHYKYFLKLGIPLIISALSGWGILSLDKLFIKYLLSIELVGIYYMASTLSSPMFTIITSFSRAWIAFAYNNIANGHNQKVFNVAVLGFLFFILIALLISTLGVFIYKFIISKVFYHSLSLIPIMVFGLSLRGIFTLLNPFILHKEKTNISALIVFISLVVNVILNYLFINIFGMIGAAIASFFAYLVMGLLPLFYVIKSYKLKIQFSFKISDLKKYYLLNYRDN